MNYSQLSELKKFAEDLTKEAGAIILDQRNSVKIVRRKDVRDVALNVDIAVEKYIINTLEKTFPKYSIFSEETGQINKGSKYKWVVDPLDGTKAFLRNLPRFSSNICLTENDVPLVSAVYYPGFDTVYSAAKGLGAFVNGKKVKLSTIKKLTEAYVSFYLPTKNRKVINYESSWNNIRKVADRAYRVQGESNVTLALCFLANGGMETYLDLSNPPHWHDLASGLLIATEAGALVLDAGGKPVDKNNLDLIIACNNQSIYNQIRQIIF